MEHYSPVIRFENSELNNSYVEPFVFTKTGALIFLITIIALFGIIIPAIPFTVALIGLLKKRAKHVFVTYASFIISAIWLAFGVVMLVIILTCI